MGRVVGCYVNGQVGEEADGRVGECTSRWLTRKTTWKVDWWVDRRRKELAVESHGNYIKCEVYGSWSAACCKVRQGGALTQEYDQLIDEQVLVAILLRECRGRPFQLTGSWARVAVKRTRRRLHIQLRTHAKLVHVSCESHSQARRRMRLEGIEQARDCVSEGPRQQVGS
eukprot:6191619-Pleurochrysis_carterae.AAC.3